LAHVQRVFLCEAATGFVFLSKYRICECWQSQAMSDLRRRIFGVGTPDSTPSSSRDNSPAPARPGNKTTDKTTDYKIVPADQAAKISKQKHSGRKRRNAWIFGLGGLVGVLAAGIFASPTGSLDRLADMAGWNDMNFDSILDVLPAGLIKDVQQLQVR
jgi:phospholipid:diacylglycerol acyltransferase